MAIFFTSSYFAALALLVFHFKILTAEPSSSFSAEQSSSFSFKSFGKDPTFESNIALYGDSKVVNGGYSVQLTNSVRSSSGRVMYKKPIKLVGGNPRNLASFSTNFSFSISKESGDGLAFVMAPNGFNFRMAGNSSFGLSIGSDKSKFRVVAVEFDTLRDVDYGDLNENHVGIDVGSLVSVKVTNVSSENILLNSNKKLNSWIDYEASSKRLEVRLSQSHTTKPVDPLLSYPIDLSKMWNDEEVFVGLSSSNGNSTQTCYLYSWSFKLRHIPHWMHSQPLDPQTFAKNSKTPQPLPKRSDCLLRVLAALISGAACGALGATVVLYLWTIFTNRRPVVPEEFVVHPVDFDYNKVKIVLDKAVKDGKN
ncbi:L-type lectin-domain containing receptor kinase VIII.2-like [Melia azedarach]|uniref:L-type lectin-domain containing receptor kinase VIII.2-like n=1 Tax=Melia azedarach TaxID=155640 RepID=A0ACC1X2V8_MELAZ|nr:L-type lectin-domain containing receptor kinase VIII.2-like [Melia azedarach]